MSTSSSGLICITGVSVSLSDSAGSNKRLTSGKLCVGARKYKLICHDGTLSQHFDNNVEISSNTPVVLSYKRAWPWKKTERIDAHHLLESFAEDRTRGLSVVQGDIRVSFDCQLAEATPPAPHSNVELFPTTKTILDSCPRFRILVIGKSGVGKSTLINIAFGIEKVAVDDLQRGKADINEGLESRGNNRFILHDSLGFEPGDKVNYETVKQFIQDRQKGPLKDQLHAVWFCVKTPQAGERLLEVAAEDFFRSKEETMGSIPLIVVFTKFDSLVDEKMVEAMASKRDNLNEAAIALQAYLEAESIVQAKNKEIALLAGESLPYAAISTKGVYRHTLQHLVDVTHQQVEMRDAPDAQVTSEVTMMAQRIDPHLKIKGTIDVGKQRYWKTLRTSSDFTGYKIWDCLSVIHTDIVAVWNFNDPSCFLLDQKFKELVIEMVKQVPMRPPTNFVPGLGAQISGEPLTTAVSDFMNKLPQLAAAIIVPVAASLGAAAWVYEVLQNVKDVRHIFMAFIVDLTHIMETLFILTSRHHNKLTRRAIKIAYCAYMDSDVRRQAHTFIQTYSETDGLDPLEMIESLIRPEMSGSSDIREYYAEIGKLDLRKLSLDLQENWVVVDEKQAAS